MIAQQQETIHKWKDPSVIMTANGTAQTTEDATVYVCDLDILVQVQLLKELPAVLSLGTLCEANGYSYDSHEWHPDQPSILIKNGRNIECKTSKNIPLVVPGAQATKHGRIAEGIFKYDTRISSGHGHTTSSNSSFRASSSKTYFKQIRRHAQYIHTISQRPELRSMQTHDSYESATQKNILKIGRTEKKIAERFGVMITADHEVLNEDQESALHHSVQ